jgi:alkanesulfonate monooxygenase SsuD/methylene tetrahydromethanopterin reductase-like flavin-dependent oxidoreductase (luciferase family)
VVSLATFTVTDDVAAGLAPVRAVLGFYIGGMGARGANYHANLMARMGYPEEAATVQELFLAGRRDEAIAAVPEDFADEISLVGPPARIRARLDAWHRSPVTTLMVTARSVGELAPIADLVAG